MKKNISMFLVLIMSTFFLTGCSGNKEVNTDDVNKETVMDEETKDDKETGDETDDTEGETFTIGINYFGNAPVLVTLANNAAIVFEASGYETTTMDDEFTVDKIVQDIENMISSGVDGLVVWAPVDSLYPVISEMCLEAEVPFVLSDKVPIDESIKEQLFKNPYFVGGIAPENAKYGEAIADFAIDQGWKSVIVNTSQLGDPSDQPRYDAFEAKFKASGGEILDVIHSEGSDGGLTQVENSLIANENPDFIYGVGSSFGVGAVTALEKFDYDTKVVTTGLEEAVLNELKKGTIAMANGDNWVCGTFAAVVLLNHLDGTPLTDVDGNVAYVNDVGFYNVVSEQVDLYKKIFIDNNAYSDEEMKMMSGKNNPDFDYDAMIELIENYTFENRVKAKVEDGTVTQEEAKEVNY